MSQSFRFGGLESRLLFTLEESEAGLMTSGEIARLLKISQKRANKLAWQLARKNRLLRVKKGVYLFAPMKAGERGRWSEGALAIVPQVMGKQPYYVSFWAALSHYGLTEQLPLTVQVAVLGRLRSFKALGSKFQFIRMKKLGEYRTEEVSGKKVNIATLEQLIIDCLAHPEYCGGIKEAAKAVWESRKRIDSKRLNTLAAGSNDAVRRRLGFILETLGLHSLKIKKESMGWRWLDPSAPKKANEKSGKWGLKVNVTKKELIQWMET